MELKYAAAALLAVAVAAFLAYFVYQHANAAGAPGPGSTTAGYGTAVIYGPTGELGRLSKVFPQANSTTLACSYSTDCTLVRTDACFNNLGNQQACISGRYAGAYAGYYNSYRSSSSGVCAQYLVNASVACQCIQGECAVSYRSA